MEKSFDKKEYENSSKYTFYGLRRKKVAAPNEELPSNDFYVKEPKLVEKVDKGVEIDGEVYEALEQQYITKQEGRIYGLHKNKVRLESNELDLGYTMAGMSRYPAFYINKRQQDLKEGEKLSYQ